MNRLSFLLAGLAIVLAFAIGIELKPDTMDEGAMAAPSVSALPPRTADLADATPDTRQSWANTVLARPLFFPDRRPADVMASTAATSTLPRVTGILLDGPRRRIIFAGVGGGRSRVVAEGGEIDGFRLTAIEAGQATLTGRDGSHVVRPRFDQNPPAVPGPATPGIPAANSPGVFPNLQSLSGIPGLPAAR